MSILNVSGFIYVFKIIILNRTQKYLLRFNASKLRLYSNKVMHLRVIFKLTFKIRSTLVSKSVKNKLMFEGSKSVFAYSKCIYSGK